MIIMCCDSSKEGHMTLSCMLMSSRFEFNIKRWISINIQKNNFQMTVESKAQIILGNDSVIINGEQPVEIFASHQVGSKYPAQTVQSLDMSSMHKSSSIGKYCKNKWFRLLLSTLRRTAV